jgi:predicted HAD superfamily phosphohydrolase YqeG
MVGDAATDIAAGKSVGCRTALIAESEDFQHWEQKPETWAESLALAAKRILAEKTRIGRTGE